MAKNLTISKKFQGLVSVNLSNNQIDDIDEVCALNRLPMLQSVELMDNPLTSEPDYRSQILGRIPGRINDIVVSVNFPVYAFARFHANYSSIVLYRTKTKLQWEE